MKATHLNSGALADLVVWAGRANITKNADGTLDIPNGYPRTVWNAPSPAHVRRCVKLGLLSVVDKTTLRVSAEGVLQIKAYMASYIEHMAWRLTAEPKGSTDRLYADWVRKTMEIHAFITS